jgi:hypothetical protein
MGMCGFGKESISGVCMNALEKSVIDGISMCGFGKESVSGVLTKALERWD